MWSMLRLVRDLKPASGILENVAGLKTATPGQASPLSILQRELQGLGYNSAAVDMNQDRFATVTRARSEA